MRHPSKPAFQSIYLQHCFPIIPNSEYLFKKGNHQLCVTSLSWGTIESHQKISKDKDVPQSLIYVRDIVKERVKDHDLSRIKIRPYFF